MPFVVVEAATDRSIVSRLDGLDPDFVASDSYSFYAFAR